MPRPVRRWLITIACIAAFYGALLYTRTFGLFSAAFAPYLSGSLFTFAAGLFLAPALVTLGLIFVIAFHHEIPTSDNPWIVVPGLIVAGMYSYVIWSTVLSRFWKVIGLWNPFGSNIREMRPYHLKVWVAITQWSERERDFGQHATGGFAGLIEVLSNRFKEGDIFLGRPKLWIGGMLRPIGIPTQKHMVTIAGTGSGKSTGALIPNLCLHRGSLLCVDPKGELAAITGRRRGQGGGGVRGMGQKVFVLNPFNLPMLSSFGGASYNVFDEMARVAAEDAERPVSYAAKVAQALVPSTSRDPYWDDAPRTFIQGLLLHILQGPPEKRNLVRLRELIMEGDSDAYGAFRQAGGRSEGDAFDALITMMKNSPNGPYQHVIRGTASALSRMSPNQRGSVMSMAMQHTSFLDVPEIRRISMTSDFLLEDLKREYISVYLCLPLNAVSGVEARWLRMFVLLTVDMMTRVQKAPNPPLLMAIDEFPSLGKLDGIESVAPTMRSQGVRLWVAGQDIKQFEAVYPDSWDSFIGGAEAVQFMGVTHPPTVAYIAERLGEHVVTQVQGKGEQAREVTTERALRDAEQIARMLSPDGKNQIVWRGNKRPMLLKITPYFSYMPWWYYSRDTRFSQKLRQALWRHGDDPWVPTPAGPHIPPKPPDDDPPDDDGPRGTYLPAFTPPVETKPVEPIVPLKPAEPTIPEPAEEKLSPQPRSGVTNFFRNLKVPGEDETIGALFDESERMRKVNEEWLKQGVAARLKEIEKERGEAAGVKPDAFDPDDPFGIRKKGKLTAPVSSGISPSDNVPGTRLDWGDALKRDPVKPPPKEPPVPQKLPRPKSGSSAADAALAELDAMIGLDGVKQQVRKTMNMLALSQARKRKGMKDMGVTHHLVFTGNPGTGKTTVARIVGRIYREIGLLQSGHLIEAQRSDFIAGFLGQTALKTAEVIKQALGGVLFIDEAYTLTPQPGASVDLASEAIAELLKAMEDNRDRLVVIAAGYKDEMDGFINGNPGLKSRFKTIIDFADYSSAELFQILVRMASDNGMRFSSDAMIAASWLMESLETGAKGFGNGRTVRNIFEECWARQGLRYAANRRIDITVFEQSDIPKPGEMNFA